MVLSSDRIGCLVMTIVAGLLLLDKIILAPNDSAAVGSERPEL